MRLISSQALPAIDSASALDTIQFDVGVAEVPETEWIVRVSVPTDSAECDTTNNETRSGAAVCP